MARNMSQEKIIKKLQETEQKLKKRIKELNCLYAVSRIVEKTGISLEEIFRETVKILPHAWQYPDVACAKIIFEGKEFNSGNCGEYEWQQATNIVLKGKNAGMIRVCYFEKKPYDNGSPFLKEEKKLREAVAEQLGRIAERIKAEEEVKKISEEWDRAFNAISDIVFMQDENYNITRVNKAFCGAVKLKPAKIIGRKCYELLHKSDKPWPGCPFGEAMKDKKSHTAEINDPKIGASLLVTASPIIDENGRFCGGIHIAKDITPLKAIRKELEKKMQDLEKFNRIAIGRELKMKELKARIKELETKLGEK